MRFSPLSEAAGRIHRYGRMVKFSHTVFALPFALAAVILAQRVGPLTLADLGWILLAMAGARSAAMGFNRIADRRFDAQNPRTRHREIPSGQLSLSAAVGFVALFSALFVLAAAMLAPICFYLSFPVLAILFGYSYSKRFTWLAHLILGFAISLAPLGAWLAIAKSFYPPILLLCLALMSYIAGFDILYACQDIEFDRRTGLYSIPARFGMDRARQVSAILHILCFGFFWGLYLAFHMGEIYLFTLGLIGFLLILEHWLVREHLDQIDIAFFHVNSLISVLLWLGVWADELVRGV